jgi:3-hydroxybutyryl-CoA dehydrogenase
LIEVKKEGPGFVGNRLQFALFREAQYILEQGIASKEDIDAAVTYGIGRRLPVTGPLVSADMGGLDVFSAIADYLFNDLSNANCSPPVLKKMVEDEKFGAKTGEGYYKWDSLFLEKMNQKREKELIRFLVQDSEGNE